jgi:hypothetical protein
MLEAQRGSISVEHHAVYRRSSEVSVTHRSNMSKVGVQFLVGVEDAVLREVISRLNRAHALAPRPLVDRLGVGMGSRSPAAQVRSVWLGGRLYCFR